MSSNAGQVILVEGMGDLHTIAGFFQSLGLTSLDDRHSRNPLRLVWNEGGSRLNIVSADSVQNVTRDLRTLHVLEKGGISDCNTLALVVDADSSPADRWRSVAAALRTIGHEPPTSPKLTGTILASDTAAIPRIGVWIMPDNQRAGMLETFLGTCVPDESTNPVWKTAVSQTDGLTADVEESLRFKNVHLDKAKIHAYLAWSEPPGLPFGQAILKNVLNSESELAQVFLQWIRNVFGFPGAKEE